MKAIELLALGLLVGCSSVAWQEIPNEMPRRWRHLELHRGRDAFVAARDDDAAADAYLQIETVVQTVREASGLEPGIGLVLAVDLRTDEQLAGQPDPDWPLLRARLPVAGVEDVDPESARRLGALMADSTGMVLVCAEDARLAAALVALKSFVVDGTDRDEALELGGHLGAGDLARHLATLMR